MRFTALEEYGLRCMLQFARHTSDCTGPALLAKGAVEKGDGMAGAGMPGAGMLNTGTLLTPSLTIGEIAQIEGLTPQYAGKLIRILRLGKLLESVRGRHGGYRLVRPPDQISVLEVISVLGGRIFDTEYCSRYTGDRKLCVHSVDCAIRSLWGTLQESVDRILGRTTLCDLLGTERKVGDFLGGVSREGESHAEAEAAKGSTFVEIHDLKNLIHHSTRKE